MSALIGRDAEIDTLEKALHAAQGGVGCCILLTGEAGIGKSRLIEELRRQAASESFTIFQGNCFEQGVSLPYAPWIDALRASMVSLGPAEIEQFLGALAPEFMELLPELGLLLPQTHSIPRLEPQAEKYRLFESFVRLISSTSTSNPVLFILEDLHWGDALSLELVQYFARRIQKRPIMLAGTYRSDEPSLYLTHIVSDLNRERLAGVLRLARLNRAEVEQMTQAILETNRPVQASLLDDLMALSEGNPFFIEEILKTLPGSGGIDQLQIPRSIQDSVKRRLEKLPESTQEILSFAAVIGERFDFGLLQEIIEHDEQSLLQMLKELLAAQLIVEQSADQFAFRHALTRQAVYTTLMLRSRRTMHQTIGEALERLAETRSDPAMSQLAYHFYHGGVWQKAIEYSQRAGEKARALYAPREALMHFTHALDAAHQLGIAPRFSSLRGRARAYEVLGEFEHARADYELTLDLSLLKEDYAGEWQARIDLGLLWQARDLDRAGRYYREAMELARHLEDSSSLAQSLNRMGNWYMNRGLPAEALALHREALELFQQLDDPSGLAQTMDLLGTVSYQLGDVIQGAKYLEGAVSILRRLDDRQGMVHTLISLAGRARLDTAVLGHVNYEQLFELSERALAIAQGFNWPQGQGLALIEGAKCLGQTGDYSRALDWLRQAESFTDEGQHDEQTIRIHLTASDILLDLLAVPNALQHLDTAFPLIEDLGSEFMYTIATMRLASGLILQNDLARAKNILDAALSSEYPDGPVATPQRRLWFVRADLELAQDNPSRALEIIEWLIVSTTNLKQYGPYAVPRLSRMRGQALAALGRSVEAEGELQGTIPVARRQGQRPMLWRLHNDLGKVYRAMRRRKEAAHEFASARSIIQDLAREIPEGALRDNFLKQALAAIPPAPVLTPRQMAKRESGGLTEREHQVASLIAQGKSNREIARTLVISEKTVERHVANILGKLGYHARTQVAAWEAGRRSGQ